MSAKNQHEKDSLEKLRARIIGRGSRYAGRRRELSLAGVRAAFAKTQVEVAETSQMAQADVSRLEHSEALDEVRIGTLRRYVSALGGELELSVLCPNGARIVIRPDAAEEAPVKAAAGSDDSEASAQGSPRQTRRRSLAVGAPKR